MKALERANRVRLARAALKRDISAGVVAAADVVEAVPWCAESMQLLELLTSQRRWGRARTRRMLLSLGLSENKALGSMTERQRGALAHALRHGRVTREVPLRAPVRVPHAERRYAVSAGGAGAVVHLRRPGDDDYSLCGVRLRRGDVASVSGQHCQPCKRAAG